MKYIYAIPALALCAAAQAATLELSVGQTQYQKIDNTNWWQDGPASQGFSNDFKLTTVAASIGLTGDLSEHTRWRLGYIDLGSATSNAMATADDSMYNAATHQCNPGCRMNRFVGSSDSDGVYATSVYTWHNGLFVEGGAWIYRNHMSMTATSGVGMYNVPAEDTFQAGPVLGMGYSHGNVSVAAAVYDAQRTGQWPGIFAGYASVISVRYEFK